MGNKNTNKKIILQEENNYQHKELINYPKLNLALNKIKENIIEKEGLNQKKNNPQNLEQDEISQINKEF